MKKLFALILLCTLHGTTIPMIELALPMLRNPVAYYDGAITQRNYATQELEDAMRGKDEEKIESALKKLNKAQETVRVFDDLMRKTHAKSSSNVLG